MKEYKKYFSLLFILILIACASTRRRVSTEEEKKQQAILLAKAQQWHQEREQRILKVAQDLMKVATNLKPLTFHLANSLDDSGGACDPDSVNAWTDGKKVYITRGMIRFIQNNDELAIILGHEMSHAYNLSKAVKIKQTAKTIAGITLGVLGIPGGGALVSLADAATMQFDQDEERKSDEEGLQWAHKAGYDISKAPVFWERFATQIPESIKGGFLSSHPGSAERFLNMQKIIEELKKSSAQVSSATTPNVSSEKIVKAPLQPITTQSIPKKKDSREIILEVQKKLLDLGYNPGPADGIMGKKTKTALKQYQKDKGLAETGEINEATLASLGIKE